MPAKMYYDDAADLAIIRGKKVAVIGYGSQGHAHALNLKDSGVTVKVGVRAGSPAKAEAEAAGIEAVSVKAAAAWPAVIILLAPDTAQAKIYRDDIAPGLSKGKMLMFAHGFNIRFGWIQP